MQQVLDVDRTELREIWEESNILHAYLKKSFAERKETACNENVRYMELVSGRAVSYHERSYTLYSARGLASFHFSCAEVHAFVLRVGRSNYSRWGTLFLEDCLEIQRKFRVSRDALQMVDG